MRELTPRGVSKVALPPSGAAVRKARGSHFVGGFAVTRNIICSAMPTGRLQILLVEDDPSVAEMYKLKLEIDGYRVTVAGDGEEGLAKARELRPHLIFLDVRLPKMDGMSVLEVMRGDDRTRHIPVLILSNYSETPLIERGLKLGAREYLIKSETTPSYVSARARTYVLRDDEKGAPKAKKPAGRRSAPTKKT